MSIDTMNFNELVDWIKKTSRKELIEYMIDEDFDFLINLNIWITQHTEPNSYVTRKIDEVLLDMEERKIELLGDGIISLKWFTNRELIRYTKPLVENEYFRENEDYKIACEILGKKLKELQDNSIINTIDSFINEFNMNEQTIHALLANNNYNIYDILIKLYIITSNEKESSTIEDLINGKYNAEPVITGETRLKNEMFVAGLLRKKILWEVDDNGDGILVDNYYETLYEIGPGINPQLVDLETDYQEGINYKMRILRNKNLS